MPRRTDRRRSRTTSHSGRSTTEPPAPIATATTTGSTESDRPIHSPFWTTPRLVLAVGLLLGVQATLAITSLVRENPTVDEVAHLPAGLSYWQTGTFRLYPHNPPLVKMLAALPVWIAGPDTSRFYNRPSWRSDPPVHASMAHEFAVDNASRYFELFTLGRLVIPAFAVLGGVVVFLWSRRLYGPWGGLLSLVVWVFCPNILAHARLVTTDLGATALGILATYLFWLDTKSPSRQRALWAGIALGLACLAKFSNVLLFVLWPCLWILHVSDGTDVATNVERLKRTVRHATIVVGIALLTINLGFGFEGTGQRLGSFEFGSALLTRPRPSGERPPSSANSMLNLLWQYRVNRFRDTWLGALPAPLPRYFLIGFDLQKIDAEGVPRRLVDPGAPTDERIGYPVYLDGELRSSGWWYYYLAAAAYKVPEGTWILGLAALVVLITSRKARASWPDELSLALVPTVVLAAMSFGTDINLGLRYILPTFPYLFIAMGKLAPWALGLGTRTRGVAAATIGACLLANVIAVATIHPHYLAYFNWISGGPDRGSEHLIDSNLDWGQDLVNLPDWMREHAPGEPVGLAYFGQINPNIVTLRDPSFRWFLPPVRPGTIRAVNPAWPVDGPAARLEPGLYAVSASFVRGLPYSIYDPSWDVPNLYPAWDGRNTETTAEQAFSYFAAFDPIDRIGHSIFVYRITPEQASRWNAENGPLGTRP